MDFTVNPMRRIHMKKPGIAALLLALVLPAMAFAKGLPQIQPATAIKIINKAMDKKWGHAGAGRGAGATLEAR